MQIDEKITGYAPRNRERQTLSIRIEKELYESVRTLAQKEYVSINSLINRMLMKKVERTKPFSFS